MTDADIARAVLALTALVAALAWAAHGWRD